MNKKIAILVSFRTFTNDSRQQVRDLPFGIMIFHDPPLYFMLPPSHAVNNDYGLNSFFLDETHFKLNKMLYTFLKKCLGPFSSILLSAILIFLVVDKRVSLKKKMSSKKNIQQKCLVAKIFHWKKTLYPKDRIV